MKKQSNSEIKVNCYYKNAGEDIMKILRDFILLFVAKEVNNLVV